MSPCLPNNHPLLMESTCRVIAPADREAAGDTRFETLDGRCIATCSNSGFKAQLSKLWVNGSPILEASSGKQLSAFSKPVANEIPEWRILFAATRELVASVQTTDPNSFHDLFTLPIRNGSNVKIGSVKGALRPFRWIPFIGNFVRQRTKIMVDDRVGGRIDRHAQTRSDRAGRGKTIYTLSFYGDHSETQRMLIIGVSMLIAREGLP